MRTDEFPPEPAVPSLLFSELSEARGLDLLGLRAPAESFALRLLDGVTTVTPTLRYLSLRSWIIWQYGQRGGMKARPAFRRFAASVEAATVIGHAVAQDDTAGLVGVRRANTLIKEDRSAFPLSPLAKNLATNIYAGPSLDLGLAGEDGGIPSLSTERGLPLAQLLDAVIPGDSPLRSLSPEEDEPWLSSDAIDEVGGTLNLHQLSEAERRSLVDAIMPPAPRRTERSRIGTYLLLLHLAAQLGRTPIEDDVFTAALAADIDGFPEALRPTLDGWARFAVRDLLVAVHEMAMAVIIQCLQRSSGGALGAAQVIGQVLDEEGIEDGLPALGLAGISMSAPISTLVAGIEDACGARRVDGDLVRWSGLNENSLLSAIDERQADARLLAFLPVAWLLAAQRLGQSAFSGRPQHDLQGPYALARLGVGAVICPAVTAWRDSSEPIGQVLAGLLRRTVDQHLRIAWSRLAREPWKDVALLHTDGEDWTAARQLGPGRASSRLYQAVNWLVQLRLIDEAGITDEGAMIISSRLALLRQENAT